MKSAPLLKKVSQKQIISDIIKELEENLPKEVDYNQELNNINTFKALMDHNTYVIPKHT